MRKTGPSTWSTPLKTKHEDPSPGYLFGHSVAIEGELVLVGAPADLDSGGAVAQITTIITVGPAGRWLVELNGGIFSGDFEPTKPE